MKAEKPILFSTAMVAAIMNGSKVQTRRVVKPQPYVDDMNHICQGNTNFGKTLSGRPALWNFVECRSPFRKGNEMWVRESWRIVGWNFDDGEMLIEYKDGEKKWCEIYDPEGLNGVDWLVKYIDSMESKGVIKVPDDYDFDRDGEEFQYEFVGKFPWKPSIHMPRCASRIQLKITDVRVEQLQAIPKSDVVREGIDVVEVVPAAEFVDEKQYMVSGCGFKTPHAAFRWLWESINGVDSWHANPWVWVVSFEKK